MIHAQAIPDDESDRAYVSKLWAEDWDCAEDSYEDEPLEDAQHAFDEGEHGVAARS